MIRVRKVNEEIYLPYLVYHQIHFKATINCLFVPFCSPLPKVQCGDVIECKRKQTQCYEQQCYISILFLMTYRKKLSKFSHQPDWDHASNYVAKCYIQEQPRSVYEQDVQLQMDSKLWGEKYSRKDPPKKVR